MVMAGNNTQSVTPSPSSLLNPLLSISLFLFTPLLFSSTLDGVLSFEPVHMFTCYVVHLGMSNCVLECIACSGVAVIQCATHRNLGWKIRVTDSVEEYVRDNRGPDTPTTCPPRAVEDSSPTPTAASPTLTAASPTLTAASYTILLSLLLVNTLALLFY